MPGRAARNAPDDAGRVYRVNKHVYVIADITLC